MWRMDHATEGGHVEIKNNYFGDAPVGAAIYSIIAPEAEVQFEIDGNKYTPNNSLLIRYAGENFTKLHEYVSKTKNDTNGTYLL